MGVELEARYDRDEHHDDAQPPFETMDGGGGGGAAGDGGGDGGMGNFDSQANGRGVAQGTAYTRPFSPTAPQSAPAESFSIRPAPTVTTWHRRSCVWYVPEYMKNKNNNNVIIIII